MNRYDYKDSIEYKKYCIKYDHKNKKDCIKKLLKIKKENIINKIKDTLNILKDLLNFEAEIKEDYELDIKLGDYMPQFYADIIYDYLKNGHNKFMNMTIDMLNNTLYYITNTINAIEKRIEDLYYTLI